MMRIRTRRQSAVLAVTKRRNLAELDVYGIMLPPFLSSTRFLLRVQPIRSRPLAYRFQRFT
jgi:hypothetical protein